MDNPKLLVIVLVALCGFSASAFVKRSPYQSEYKDKIYYFENFYKASFYKAFMACSKMRMNLLTIDSDEEFDEIHKLVKEKMDYRHGLMVWTSGAMKDLGQFHWMTTGDPVQSTRWYPGTPNNRNNREHCLHIWFYNTFLLNDYPCDTEAYFICESLKIK